MKKRILLAALLVVVLSAGVAAFSGCSRGKSFVGAYTSIWIEGRIWGVSYTLEVLADRTFNLSGGNGSINGKWVGNKSKDVYGIICYATFDDTLNGYFTLMELDDGTYIASNGAASFMGISSGYVVIFAKN